MRSLNSGVTVLNLVIVQIFDVLVIRRNLRWRQSSSESQKLFKMLCTQILSIFFPALTVCCDYSASPCFIIKAVKWYQSTYLVSLNIWGFSLEFEIKPCGSEQCAVMTEMFDSWHPLWCAQDALGYFGTCSGSWCPTRARRSTQPSLTRSAVTSKRASVKVPSWWAQWKWVFHLNPLSHVTTPGAVRAADSLFNLNRNSRPRGGSSSPPCPSMQSLWPTSAGAGPSTCYSSASRPTLKKSLALRSARWN